MKVKIIGAGSIGNHLAQASRRMGWDVVVVDREAGALARMKEQIYPGRYGAWDDGIKLFLSQDEPKGGFDVIFIGTPPDSHMKLALAALAEKPKVLQIEKPLCTPTLDGLSDFLDAYGQQSDTVCVVGYDHALSAAITEILAKLRANTIGVVQTIDVEFREHWQGIFKAHPWLSGPQDTYLGYWRRGGGASGEHSHALHLWQVLAQAAGLGQWKQVSAFMDMQIKDNTDYDSIAAFNIETNKKKIGRVIQDVVTLPARKWLRIQGDTGFIEWECNGHKEGDVVRYALGQADIVETVFRKTRPDDFFQEMLHIKDLIGKKITVDDSPVSLDSAVKVMQLLAAAYKNQGKIFNL